ncbi:Hypothetical protein SRAE_2000208400 [Strongyloides ratti]|uniref:Uncharacterized protein n=1 Tax=Strongyloides ratti TaxID=34506 RepID=A0A090LIT6_STRRB|nr:Hypothetical protein SRAE_2000208400 [Strongyloides ratti]CEF67420.1 Hypothetical protein SRAE_2000208400 [Strongyloides ratti]
MKIELKSANSDYSLNSSLDSITNTNISKRHNKLNQEVKKQSCCSTCKLTAETREKTCFIILLNFLYLGFISVTFLGISLVFRKPLCYILHGLTKYYTAE